jgi:uncharacterized protein (TIGR02001 family)
MRTTTRIASVVCGLLAVYATTAVAQEPGGEADSAETAKEVKAEDEAAEEPTGWLPGGLSGNVAIVTDYSFRGVSQTQRDMAVQGGIDWNHDSGVFVGTWASPVDFSNASGTENAYLETDFYGGYAGAIEDFSYKTSATYFYYPGADTFSYWEFGAFLGYDLGFTSLSTGVIGSPDYFGGLGTGWYIPFGFNVPIGTVSCPFPGKQWENCFDLSFDANAGYTHTETVLFNDNHHYFDYNAGLVFALPFNFKLDFRFVGTDVEDVHDAGNRFVFAAKYAF